MSNCQRPARATMGGSRVPPLRKRTFEESTTVYLAGCYFECDDMALREFKSQHGFQRGDIVTALLVVMFEGVGDGPAPRSTA